MEERFVAEFEDMTAGSISVAELEEARTKLFADILAKIDGPAMKFLLSLHDGGPDFEAMGLPQAANLPAVRWKLQNLEKLKEEQSGQACCAAHSD